MEVIRKLKNELISKGLSFYDAFNKLDINKAGLVSFGIFS